MAEYRFEIADPAVAFPHWVHRAQLLGPDRRAITPAVAVQGQSAWLRRPGAGSASVHVPWPVPGFGELVLRTASLMSGTGRYRLPTELARGELNRTRNFLANRAERGHSTPEGVEQALLDAGRLLHRATVSSDPSESLHWAERSLERTLSAADDLAKADQLDRARGEGFPAAPLAMVISPDGPPIEQPELLRSLVDHLILPVRWQGRHGSNGACKWDRFEKRFKECQKVGLPITIGPLLDFRTAPAPGWIEHWASNPEMLATVLSDLVESAVNRFHDRAVAWQIASGADAGPWLGLSLNERLWLVARMAETARNVDPQLKIVAGLARPWADVIPDDNSGGESETPPNPPGTSRACCPWSFTDCLTRCESPPTVLEIEVAMGFAKGGSLCRTALDLHEVLDRFARWGLPLRVRLSFPSQAQEANPATHWRRAPDEALQAEWAERFIAVASHHPAVELVAWSEWRDDAGCDWPSSGMLTAEGRPKAIVERWKAMRGRSLRESAVVD